LVLLGSLFGILGLVAGLISIIARIVGFHQINKVFGSLSGSDYRMSSFAFPLYGWYGVLSGVLLIISQFTSNPTVTLVLSIIVIVGESLLLLVIGYKLVRNSTKIQTTSVEELITPQQRDSEGLRSQVRDFATSEKIQKKEPRKCIKCGTILEHRGNYCEKCVTNR
jgi:hypothetical protein